MEYLCRGEMQADGNELAKYGICLEAVIATTVLESDKADLLATYDELIHLRSSITLNVSNSMLICIFYNQIGFYFCKAKKKHTNCAKT